MIWSIRQGAIAEGAERRGLLSYMYKRLEIAKPARQPLVKSPLSIRNELNPMIILYGNA
jgi:hypothetical protein